MTEEEVNKKIAFPARWGTEAQLDFTDGSKLVVWYNLDEREMIYRVHHVELLSGDLDAPAMQALGFRGEAVPTYRARPYPRDSHRPGITER